MKKEKVLVVIDGNNFYNRKKELSVKKHRLADFDYKSFVSWLAEDRRIICRNYYIGVVRATPDDNSGQHLRRKQQQLFSHLESADQKFNVIRGVLMKTDGKYREKGVDVRMAVDIVAGAYTNQYDTVVLISSDTDLIPAINLARKKNKKVIYIGFSHKPSYALQRNADFSRLITKNEIEQFIK